MTECDDDAIFKRGRCCVKQPSLVNNPTYGLVLYETSDSIIHYTAVG